MDTSFLGVDGLILCDLSEVVSIDGGWRLGISRKISGALRLFKGQILFGSLEEGSREIFLSTIKLNPSVIYLRVYLEDVRGSLAKITDIFKRDDINILSGGAFSLGNLWVSEFVLDFKGVDASQDDVINEIEGLGGFVSSREITELFPRSFDLQSTFEVSGDDVDEMHIFIPNSFTSRISETGGSASYALLNAWPRVKAIFINFIQPETKLLKITAKIQDIPGSLNALSNFLRSQVDLQAIDELHHDAVSGEWVGFGVLVMGGLDELRERADGVPTILDFKAEPLGWQD